MIKTVSYLQEGPKVPPDHQCFSIFNTKIWITIKDLEGSRIPGPPASTSLGKNNAGTKFCVTLSKHFMKTPMNGLYDKKILFTLSWIKRSLFVVYIYQNYQINSTFLFTIFFIFTTKILNKHLICYVFNYFLLIRRTSTTIISENTL